MKKNNLFLIPMAICFVLTAFVWVGLLNTGYFFEKQILATVTAVLAVWAGLFFFTEKRSKQSIVMSVPAKWGTFLAGLFIGLFLAGIIWHSGYLNLEPVKAILEGKEHIDTLFHTDIAESFMTNGYASIQFNDAAPLKYHVLSHFILSVISFVLQIPCFASYCYLYPVIFMPLYVYLLLLVLVKLRERFGKSEVLTGIDILFLMWFCFGFKILDIDAGAGMQSLFDSESCLISVVLMLFGCILCLEKERLFVKNIPVTAIIFVPIFLLVTSLAKISTGFVFYVVCCYYIFRKNPASLKNWLLIIFYSVCFFLIYKLSSGHGDANNFKLLAYIRGYTKKNQWLYFYTFLFLPSIILFLFEVKEKFLSREYLKNGKNVWFEITVVLTCATCLPGLLLDIGGGSASYFNLPSIVICMLILWGMDIPNTFINSEKKYALTLILTISMVFFPTLLTKQCFGIFYRVINDSNHLGYERNGSMRQNLSETIHNIPRLFSKSVYLQDERYKSFEELRSIMRNNKSDYCIFMSDDCYLYDVYQTDIEIRENLQQHQLKGMYAVASLLGVPVINALYTDGESTFRGDGKNLGTGLSYFYGVSSVNLFHVQVTEANMKEYARRMGKKKIIVLTGEVYRLVDVE